MGSWCAGTLPFGLELFPANLEAFSSVLPLVFVFWVGKLLPRWGKDQPTLLVAVLTIDFKRAGVDGFSERLQPLRTVVDQSGVPTGAGWAKNCQARGFIAVDFQDFHGGIAFFNDVGHSGMERFRLVFFVLFSPLRPRFDGAENFLPVAFYHYFQELTLCFHFPKSLYFFPEAVDLVAVSGLGYKS